MAVSYAQKRLIITHLGQQDLWQNLFDADFFNAPYRKWPSKTDGDIQISHEINTGAYLLHKPTGSSLSVEKEEDVLVVTDESGKRVVIKSNEIQSVEDDLIKVENVDPTDALINGTEGKAVELSDLNLFVNFAVDGRKSLFLSAARKRLDFPQPSQNYLAEIPEGRFLHGIPFTSDIFLDLGGNIPTSVKLIVAKDFGVEPDLRALNSLHYGAAAQDILFLENWGPQGLAQKNVIPSSLEVAWTDSTEFTGYRIALPNNFALRKTEQGFTLLTTLDGRERIFAHSAVLQSATVKLNSVVDTVNSKTPPHQLLETLSDSDLFSDHRGGEWNGFIFESKHSAEIAAQIRAVMTDNLHISGQDCAIINFDEGRCLLAIRNDTLANTLDRYDELQENHAMLEERTSGLDVTAEQGTETADQNTTRPSRKIGMLGQAGEGAAKEGYQEKQNIISAGDMQFMKGILQSTFTRCAVSKNDDGVVQVLTENPLETHDNMSSVAIALEDEDECQRAVDILDKLLDSGFTSTPRHNHFAIRANGDLYLVTDKAVTDGLSAMLLKYN